jgi:hypothetical protein
VLDDGGNIHSDDHLYMNGLEIFSFTARVVPAESTFQSGATFMKLGLAPGCTLPFDIRPQPLAQCTEIDIVHTAGTGQIQRMRRGRSHRDARTHHAHA